MRRKKVVLVTSQAPESKWAAATRFMWLDKPIPWTSRSGMVCSPSLVAGLMFCRPPGGDGRRPGFKHLYGAGIAVGSIGDIYVIGTTGYGGGVNMTADFPTVRAFQPKRINKSFQTFISKITARNRN
jgi:hypothetical protein